MNAPVTMIATVWPEMVEGVGYTVTWVGDQVLAVDKREVARALMQQPLNVAELSTSDVVGIILNDIDPDEDHSERVAAAHMLAGLGDGSLVAQLETLGEITPNWNMLSKEQVAPMLGVSAKTVWRMVDSGEIIDCRWLGNKLLFRWPDDVEAILEKAKPTHPEHPGHMTAEEKLRRVVHRPG